MTPMRLPLLYLMFASSGFCGLIYRSIWAKYLKRCPCAKLFHRIRNSPIAYAIVELVVGLFAIRFRANFLALTDSGYSTLLPATCDTTSWCVWSWVLATSLILPQSILLGMTLQLMTAGVLRA